MWKTETFLEDFRVPLSFFSNSHILFQKKTKLGCSGFGAGDANTDHQVSTVRVVVETHPANSVGQLLVQLSLFCSRYPLFL